MNLTIEQLIATIDLTNKPYVDMDKFDIERARLFTNKKYEKAILLGENLGDRTGWVRRNIGGFLAELGIERYIGSEFVDESIESSKKTSVPDLRPLGLDYGVKTSTIDGPSPNVALVPIRPKYPEIITVLKHNKYNFEFGDRVYILGIASVRTMMLYSNRKYVRSPNVPDWKTGFYGYDKLETFKHISDLQLAEY